MKNPYFLLLLAFLYHGQLSGQNTALIFTDSTTFAIDSFFGTVIIDRYRTLENLGSAEVRNWVTLQDEAATTYLRKLKGNNAAYHTIETYGNTDFELPLRQGDYYFRWMYTFPNRPAALYSQKSRTSEPYLLLNPDDISRKDNISIGRYKLSKDSRFLEYQFHRGGLDWAEIKVKNMNGKDPDDHLKQVKFSDIYWQGNGFYYSIYRVDDSLTNLVHQEVYYHPLGYRQPDDQLVFRRPQRPSTEIDVQVSSDERFCIIRERDKKADILNYYLGDANDPGSPPRLFLRKPKHHLDILDSHEGYLYALTSLDRNTRTVVRIDPADPLAWKQVVPPVEGGLLQDAVLLDNYIAAVFQTGTEQKLVFFSYGGEIKHVVAIPANCVFGPLRANKYDKDLIYYFQSYLVPPIVSRIDLKTFKDEFLQKTGITYDITDFEEREVEFPSKDGTLVPMTLLFKKGLKRDGKNPTLLSAYGGFGIVSDPNFQPGLVYFLSKGGVYAFAKIRGGGEKGALWHLAGSGPNKQNTFDDFIAAAEYLIREKYTAPRHLAITGASHGGLVVGAALTQRPELFQAAVPVVGVFDMLRFERFTVGDFHTGEFGTVKTAEGFKQLLSYSPLHNIKPDVNYPATLIITAENDDRVPPLHSYKFAAALQNNPGQTNPVLLLVKKKSGHGLANTHGDRVRYEADVFSFVLFHTRE